MNKRPLSVSIIGWLLIVIGTISLIASLAMINNPNVKAAMEAQSAPVSVQYAIAYISLVLSIITGIGILKGQNWARVLYIVLSVCNVIYRIIISAGFTIQIIPGIVILAIVVFFLYRPKSNVFFKKT